MTAKISRILILSLTLGFLSACSSRSGTQVDTANQGSQVIVVQAPGVVEYVWEEPMVDVVEVPPGLDPEGIYYRPAHRQVIENRQGRWQYHRKPQDVTEK